MEKTLLTENLLFLRTYYNYTQKYLAKILNTSQPNYCDIEKGRTSLSENFETKIETLYEIPIQIIRNTSKANLAVLLDKKHKSKKVKDKSILKVVYTKTNY